MSKENIYCVWIEQTFYAIKEKDSGKWYKPNKMVRERDAVTGFDKLILAEDLTGAIDKYKSRFNWDHTDFCINAWYGCMSYDHVDKKNPEFHCEVKGKIDRNHSLNELKKWLRADEFIKYCKQELYPIEVILADTKLS